MKINFKNIRMGAFAYPQAKRRGLRYSHAGFSLIETIVAIGVILTGLVAVLVLLNQGIRSVRVAESRLIASNLAQEAIEIIVNIRDTNWLANQNWRTNLPATTAGIVSYNSTAVNEVAPNSFCMSLIGGTYAHGAPPCNTIFNRHVEIIDRTENISGTDVNFIEIRAIIEWSQGGSTRSINVIDHLYDWK